MVVTCTHVRYIIENRYETSVGWQIFVVEDNASVICGLALKSKRNVFSNFLGFSSSTTSVQYQHCNGKGNRSSSGRLISSV